MHAFKVAHNSTVTRDGQREETPSNNRGAVFRTEIRADTDRFVLEWNKAGHHSFSILIRVVFVLTLSGDFKRLVYFILEEFCFMAILFSNSEFVFTLELYLFFTPVLY